jgi:uroporphyrinogen III methyltransferase/synthase
MNRPLFGKNIVVTRDEKGNAEFAAKLVRRGANPIRFATIKIKPLTQNSAFVKALAKINQYHWLIFTSVKGVELFFDSLAELNKDARAIASAKIAAIGSKTAEKLSQFGIKADFVPTVFTTSQLGKELIGFTNLQGKKILLLRSKLASDELYEILAAAGAEVENVAIYEILTIKSECNQLAEKIANGRIHWLTFASPSAAKGFFEQIDAELVNLSSAKVASIGPVTTEQLQNLGVKVELTATEHTLDGLLADIEKMYK